MKKTRRALLASLLVAVTVSLGLALSGVPNVELMTVSVFMSGFLLGPLYGVAIGTISILLHSLLNPLGAAMPLLLASQLIGFGVIGLSGGLLGGSIANREPRLVGMLIAGTIGLVLTVFYDVVTNVGAFYSISGSDAPQNLLAFVVAGISFGVLHVVWNTALFFLMLLPMLNVLQRFRHEVD